MVTAKSADGEGVGLATLAREGRQVAGGARTRCSHDQPRREGSGGGAKRRSVVRHPLHFKRELAFEGATRHAPRGHSCARRETATRRARVWASASRRGAERAQGTVSPQVWRATLVPSFAPCNKQITSRGARRSCGCARCALMFLLLRVCGARRSSYQLRTL